MLDRKPDVSARKPPALARKLDLAQSAVVAIARRALGTAEPITCERTEEGVSTQVYRLVRGSETFYLRVAEEPEENLETDAELHEHLDHLGVRVPRVVHVEPFEASIDRSIMITTEVPGAALADLVGDARAGGKYSQAAVESIVAEAGADLAVLNQQPVDGFGWVRRHGRGWPLRAEHSTYDGFLVSELPDPWPGGLSTVFTAPVLDEIAAMIDHERRHPPDRARLAHGDFDTSPIFCRGGRYTGLIDFGEIRGTEPTFDLGHFHLHDGESVPLTLLPALLRGYQRVQPLPPGHRDAIRRSAVLLGLRQLCRWLGPLRNLGLEHPMVRSRIRRITELVEAVDLDTVPAHD